MSSHIFLSHSNADEDQSLIANLEKLCALAGLELYVAERQPEYVTRISDKIKKKIDSSLCLVALLTGAASQSHFVGNEVGYAEDRIPIIVILEEGVKLTGFRHGYETIAMKRTDPADALTTAAQYVRDRVLTGQLRSRERGTGRLEERKEAVLKQVDSLFDASLKRRLALFLEVSLEHKIVKIKNFKFVKSRLKLRQDLDASDSPDFWRFTAFAEQAVSEKLASLGTKTKTYQVHNVLVQGKPMSPQVIKEQWWERAEYGCDLLPGPEISIEVDYSYLCWPEDVYFFQAARFARHIRFMYRKHPQLRYEAVETGGLEPIHPEVSGPFKNVVGVERKGLVFPGWGYMVHWRHKHP